MSLERHRPQKNFVFFFPLRQVSIENLVRIMSSELWSSNISFNKQESYFCSAIFLKILFWWTHLTQTSGRAVGRKSLWLRAKGDMSTGKISSIRTDKNGEKKKLKIMYTIRQSKEE